MARNFKAHLSLCLLALTIGCAVNDQNSGERRGVLQDGDFFAGEYWRCFETKDVSWSVPTEESALSPDTAEPPRDSMISITALSGEQKYLYTLNHGVSKVVCEDIATALATISENEATICIASWPISKLEDDPDGYDFLATFLRAKTHKGYAVYELSFLKGRKNVRECAFYPSNS